MINVYIVPKEEVEKVEWTGISLDYNNALYNLGQGRDEFIVINPEFSHLGLFEKIDLEKYQSEYSTVWHCQGQWIVKYFTKSWETIKRFYTITLDDINITWERNPDIDSSIPFINDPVSTTLNLSDLKYQLVWYIDPEFNPTPDKVWVLKAQATDFEVSGTKDMGYLTPDVLVRIIYNRDIPKIDYNFDYKLPWYDLKYECVWYLDNQFNPTIDKVWAIKLKVRGGGVKPIKDMGYVKPKIVYNPALPELNYTIEDKIPYYDLNYEHIWLVDDTLVNSYEEIWAAKIVPHESKGVKVVGKIKVDLPEQLDVVFISYNEPNAEDNWQRVLEKAPKAFRVNGVKGIVNAHKCAAELSTTDMFYVVDGDAWLEDDWDFAFQPDLFNRDCVHVWRSRNPINDLEYGYGGVKLIPKDSMLNADPANTDMTTSISNKFKVMDKVSNTTAFNTSEFNTWRSAFRECAKLSSNILKRQLSRESEKRLNVWCTAKIDVPFGTWAMKGAMAGRAFGRENAGNYDKLSLINDFEWLHSEFIKLNKISLGEH